MRDSISEEIIYIRHRAAIAGHITDGVNGKGIPCVEVKLEGKNVHTLTGEDGFYYFLDLEKGEYQLNIFVPKDSRRIYGGSDDKPTTSIQGIGVESDGKPVFDLKANVALYPTRLGGSVKSIDNQNPVPHAIIKLRGSEIQTLSDKDGKYLLSGFPAGTYTIQVFAEGFQIASELVAIAAGSDTKKDFGLSMT